LKQRAKTTIEGIVQGVGFRPFIYQLARRFSLAGYVTNTSDGVDLEVEGEQGAIEAFLAQVEAETPPLARITRVRTNYLPPAAYDGFRIEASRAAEHRSALISPDVAVCADCLRELFDPADRRHRYPFINCTNCGPRYTIITDIPYDRDKTSMRHFKMCPDCEREYHDPMDRRFHAQPDACWVCGPKVWLVDAEGKAVEGEPGSDPGSDPIWALCRLLEAGSIAAIKGLGGFHLAVDASSERAVARLRERKRREEKPLALMSADLDVIRRYGRITAAEEAQLTSRERPIVLLEKDDPEGLIAPSVAPRNRFFGVMLPYTPLHHLIMREVRVPALVMTSANLSEEPICIDNDEAPRRLSGIADYYLFHDRDIYLRSDDSILRVAAGAPRLIRRSRGFVPVPVFLDDEVPQVLAVGAEMKSTICLTKGERAFVSQHVGDLENLETLDFFGLTVTHLERILEIEPVVIAHDLHPEYLSTKWALAQQGRRVVGVQHHFAHIVSCLAENHARGPVIGLSLDGTGYGTDGRLWGGEVLIAELTGFHRAGHFRYLPLPGGAKAIKEPWRMAVAHLRSAFGAGQVPELPFLKGVDPEALRLLPQMMDKGVNSPLTSSCGRLFDAVAAMCGLRSSVAYEGQAALELEQAMPWPAEAAKPYSHAIGNDDNGLILDFAPTVREVARDVQKGVPVQTISLRFHLAVVEALAEAAERLRRTTGVSSVALSGGCFQNRFLLESLYERLVRAGFDNIYTQAQVPANDGGISLGQAVAAAQALRAQRGV
jgi:hydrogenase maturation protein HypF